jgi:hypothetical protein
VEVPAPGTFSTYLSTLRRNSRADVSDQQVTAAAALSGGEVRRACSGPGGIPEAIDTARAAAFIVDEAAMAKRLTRST